MAITDEEERKAHREAKIKRIKASPEYRSKVKQGVKTRYSRFMNRMLAPRGRFAGIVPKSVALHNMCGDNAYERTS